MTLDGWYSPLLVVVSVLIAALASYTALDLAARVNAASGRERLGWLAGGSTAMGVGIWSMHFVGMLAFHLPVPIAYAVELVLVSVLIAIAASALALAVVSRPHLTWGTLAVSALWMGPAIAGMHYVGMAAMRVDAHLHYDGRLVAVSIVIAILASFAGLWLAYRFRGDESSSTQRWRAASGCVMGGAIAGMHYTGMAAASFTANGPAGPRALGGLLATRELTVGVAVATGIVLALGLLGAKVDRWLRARLETAERRREAQKLEAIGQLAGGIAHDFNNILTAIGNYAAFIAGSLPPTAPQQADVTGIREAVDRAAALTAQLLAFGRRQVVQPTALDLGEVLEEAGRLLRRLIGEHIEVTIDAPPGLSPVIADRGQLIQVVLNLAINARDAMPDGGRLTIEARDVRLTRAYAGTHLDVDPGQYVQLAVTDTGHGMTPEVQARIFEPFFTTKPRGQGTGLGLWTVFGIVKQSGGHIHVYSEPGHGTTVKVHLPRAADAAPQAAAAAAVHAELGGAETILIVEDDANIRTVAERILSRGGYTVLSAAAPSAAIELAADPGRAIHLLLSDVLLPEMTGPRLAKQLLATRPRLAVLYMSGYTENAIVQDGKLEPGVEFLAKPFGPAELLRKVREVLDRGSGTGPVGVSGAGELGGAGAGRATG